MSNATDKIENIVLDFKIKQISELGTPIKKIYSGIC
jgi:hypothetical protein